MDHGDDLMLRLDDPLSTFLQTYLDKLHHQQPLSSCIPWVFWSQDDEPSSDTWTTHKKLVSALNSKLKICNLSMLLQFWAPVETGGKRLLTTSRQPFAVSHLHSDLLNHRLCSLKYLYDIDVNTLEVEKNPMIMSGAPATAFLNRVPEIVPDLTVSDGCPLVLAALKCGLRSSFVLPIFSDPSQSRCIGVFECYLEQPYDMGVTFRSLTDELMGQGLYPFDSQAYLASMNICGLEDAKNEIDKALQVIIQVHVVEFVQVSIAYEDENHAAFLSSLDDTQKKRILGFRLTDRCADRTYKTFKSYAYDIWPLLNGKGLGKRTLQNNEAHFCTDFAIDKIECKCSCFAICFKNNKTRDLLYVFEFFWEKHSHYIITLELLFSTLKRCLPSFKLISGAQLGDELHVIDVDDSTQSGNGFFKIFEGNRSSSVSNAVDEGTKSIVLVEKSLNAKCKTAEKKLPLEKIKEQFGKTMKEAANNLNVSMSTLKRKWNKYIAEGRVPFDEWPGPNYKKRKPTDHMPISHTGLASTSDQEHDLELLGQVSNDVTAIVHGSTSVGNDDLKAHVSLLTSRVEELQSQVDKLKALCEPLVTKGEKLISDSRHVEEALKFSVNKGSEVGEIEKVSMESPQSVASPIQTSLFSGPEKQNLDLLPKHTSFTSKKAETEPESSLGFLEVYVHQARDIHNITIYHKQDVYAKICITSNPENFVTTQTIYGGGRNPVFNENLRINVPTIDSSLKYEIYMLSRVRNYLEDQLLGFALIPLSEILSKNGKLEKEFTLSSGDLFHSPSGFIHLSLSYTGASPDVIAIPLPPAAKGTPTNSELANFEKIGCPVFNNLLKPFDGFEVLWS